MIRRERGKYVLRSTRTGKVLGRHRTRAKAKAQETAINLRRARAAGHRVPPPPRRRRKGR